MKTVWRVGIAFAGLGWLLVWLEKEVTLRSKLNTKFGLEQKKKMELEEGKSEGTSKTTMNNAEFDNHEPIEARRP